MLIVLSASFVLVVLMGGVALGCATGYATAVARRAWKDRRITEKSLPGLRRGAWAATRRAAGWIAVVAAVGVVIFAGIIGSDDEPQTPASVPTVGPTN